MNNSFILFDKFVVGVSELGLPVIIIFIFFIVGQLTHFISSKLFLAQQAVLARLFTEIWFSSKIYF